MNDTEIVVVVYPISHNYGLFYSSLVVNLPFWGSINIFQLLVSIMTILIFSNVAVLARISKGDVPVFGRKP